jgi:hypothetical protein
LGGGGGVPCVCIPGVHVHTHTHVHTQGPVTSRALDEAGPPLPLSLSLEERPSSAKELGGPRAEKPTLLHVLSERLGWQGQGSREGSLDGKADEGSGRHFPVSVEENTGPVASPLLEEGGKGGAW